MVHAADRTPVRHRIRSALSRYWAALGGGRPRPQVPEAAEDAEADR